MLPSRFAWLAIVATGLTCTTAASAAPILWTLQNFSFNDGGTASGSFVFDSDLGQYSNINIVTTAGTLLSGSSYSFTTPYTGPGSPDFGNASPLLVGSTYLNFVPLSALTNAGGTVNIAATSGVYGGEGQCITAGACNSVGLFRSLNQGASIVGSDVPEPGAIGLVSIAGGGCLLLRLAGAARKRRAVRKS